MLGGKFFLPLTFFLYYFLLKMSSAATSAVQKGAFRKFLDSPAGPKTIHFWAPAMKWVK